MSDGGPSGTIYRDRFRLEWYQGAGQSGHLLNGRYNRLRSRRPVAKRAVRPDRVVLPAPHLDQYLYLLQRVKDLQVKKLVSELPVEAFGVTIPAPPLR